MGVSVSAQAGRSSREPRRPQAVSGWPCEEKARAHPGGRGRLTHSRCHGGRDCGQLLPAANWSPGTAHGQSTDTPGHPASQRLPVLSGATAVPTALGSCWAPPCHQDQCPALFLVGMSQGPRERERPVPGQHSASMGHSPCAAPRSERCYFQLIPKPDKEAQS